MKEFKVVGISYKSAPIEVRETVALSEGENKEFLLHLKEALALSEAMVVSTCNRTEIYYTSSTDLNGEIISLLAIKKGFDPSALSTYFNHLKGIDAVSHLFKVAVGLDSKVLGDIQVGNQVKRGYQASADMEMAGPFLHRLMHTIFFTNKRVVQETRFQDGNASVASVATDIIKTSVEKIQAPRIAIVGLGEIGQNVLDNLKEVEASIYLVNRTKEKAQGLVNSSNHYVEDFEDVESVVNKCDVVVCALSSEKEVIDKKSLKEQIVYQKLLIDLSVPRSISENVIEHPGVQLFNVDQLSEQTLKARQTRESAIPRVEAIIEEVILEFVQWKEEMEVSPTIKKLKEALNTIRKQELARHDGKVSDEEMNLLEVVTKNMIQKVINLPVVKLKAACKRGEANTLVDSIYDLFNLEKDEVTQR